MPEYTVAEGRRTPTNTPEPDPGPNRGASTPVDADGTAAVELPRDQQFVIQIRNELDGYVCTLRTLGALDPDQVFLNLSSITARLCEIRMQLYRSESRRFAALRSREVDPLIQECDRQFRLHSRVQAVRQMDWDMIGKGQT